MHLCLFPTSSHPCLSTPHLHAHVHLHTPIRSGHCRSPGSQCTVVQNISLGTCFQWLLDPLGWFVFDKSRLGKKHISEGTKPGSPVPYQPQQPTYVLLWISRSLGEFSNKTLTTRTFTNLETLDNASLLGRSLRFPPIHIGYPSRNPSDVWSKVEAATCSASFSFSVVLPSPSHPTSPLKCYSFSSKSEFLHLNKFLRDKGESHLLMLCSFKNHHIF